MSHHRHGISRIVREVEHLHNPKRVTRGIAKQLVYVNRIGGAAVSAAGGYFGGPVVGEALAVGFAENGAELRRVQARNEGLKGRDARRLGRSELKRDVINNSAASSLGTLTAVSFGGGTLYGGTGFQTSVPSAPPVAGVGGAIPESAVTGGITPAGAGAGAAPAASIGGGAAGLSGANIAALGGGALAVVGAVLKAITGAPKAAGVVTDASGNGGGLAGGGSGDSGDNGNPIAEAGNWIQNNPVLAILLGLGAGFLIWKAVE